MKIGIITTWFPAGAGYVSKAYEKALATEHDIFVYARGGQNKRGDSDWDNDNVTWAPKYYNDINITHFIKWAKKKKIDILFFNEQRYWKPVLKAKEAGFCIGAYIDYYTQKTVPAFEVYDFLICNTKRHYSVFKWHTNASYIPWGTDIDKFKPTVKKTDRKLSFLLNLGWEGAYTNDRKGLLLALDAFKKVKGNCKILVYSQVELSKCLISWQEKILSDNRIEFIYGTFDPFPYKNGDVYIYPSRLDGIGLSLPEALSSGLPVITSDCPPMNEFVINDVNGCLVKVEKYLGRQDGYYWAESICNLDSLADAIQKYIDNSDKVKLDSENAREFAELNLDWNVNSGPLLNIFTKAAKNKVKLNDKLTILATKLDRKMAPSLTFKALTIFKDILIHGENKIKSFLK
jgi:1,2-diacylglycerol 3-alpha-glucosyltransferase